jgi:hypothetical protein
MNKQAVHIQILLQENSKLNVKLLPDKTEIKNRGGSFDNFSPSCF